MGTFAIAGETRMGKLLRRLKYAGRTVPPYFWQRITRPAPQARVHLIICIADHFEPSSTPGNFAGYAPRDVQLRRLKTWCGEYPVNFAGFEDNDGRRFVHTYFYPAEQYDREIVQQIADLCHSGWGELEIHLHHGVPKPDTAENTRSQLLAFRDALAHEHGCLSYQTGDHTPQYAFIHGNYTLANCANGFACGVDDEMQILAETGCYVDMTFPASAFHPAQIAKVNSLYECGTPLSEPAPHRSGVDLKAGRPIAKLPFMVQGPWALDFDRTARSGFARIENGAITGAKPPSLRRLQLWRRAAITVAGRLDWIFIKLDAHGMYPDDTDTVLRGPMQHFLRELIGGAVERKEILHFVTAREMANILVAACDGKEGNPGDYRDYRYRLVRPARLSESLSNSSLAVKS
jgi:hypothetical protein